MKIQAIAIFAGTIISSSAFAAGSPNLYNCKSEDGSIEVNYTSSSLSGKPTFSVIQKGVDLTSGPNLLTSLDQQNTIAGDLVTALVTREFLMDAPSLVYAVFIPGAELGNATSLSFTTYLLTGWNGGFRALPTVMQQISSVTKLECEAKAVLF